jgi:trehalose 6-phosphate synthase/phosphatase
MRRAASTSMHNLQELVDPGGKDSMQARIAALEAEETEIIDKTQRVIIVCNSLPLKMKADPEGAATRGHSWHFELDPDSIYGQSAGGILSGTSVEKVIFLGGLGSEVEIYEQDSVAADLADRFNCIPVFLGAELKEKHYKGFCKQFLWPLMHYVLPMSPQSPARYSKSNWQGYLAANKRFADKVVEVLNPHGDFVWVHDYHLMLLPTFLRKRYNTVRCGYFLHSPFPSSEVFRTFPNRDLVLRGLLNADVVGFHTFDYARHFLSCTTRLLGLNHKTDKGALAIDYYGRSVGVKICPTGVNTDRLQEVVMWPEAVKHRAKFKKAFRGRKVFLGVDDMDIFKGIELKLKAFELLLSQHPELAESMVLVQVCNPARSSGREMQELQAEVASIVERLNATYGVTESAGDAEDGVGGKVVELIHRATSLDERIALLSIADCAVVTATRDGMNLLPYEYITCRQGPPDSDAGTAEGFPLPRSSSLIMSEFVGCSSSLSGAFRVNPWNVDDVADAMYRAAMLSGVEAEKRHEKHWKYISEHTVGYWAASNISELQRSTETSGNVRCYGLGFGLNFRVVTLNPEFRKLDSLGCSTAYARSTKRIIFLDYDGTLVPSTSYDQPPSGELLECIRRLAADPHNAIVCIVSGRQRKTLEEWFGKDIPAVGLLAEHGYWYKAPDWAAVTGWQQLAPLGTEEHIKKWHETVMPILEQYTDSTDGSFIKDKGTSVVWHYRDADPDFGAWQAKELMEHLESVLVNDPVDVFPGNGHVEIKPQGVSKGTVVEMFLGKDAGKHLREVPGGASEKIDFVLAVGDDRSDEEMFHAVADCVLDPNSACFRAMSCPMPGKSPAKSQDHLAVYCSTVGQKPSKADYYLDDPEDVIGLLRDLTNSASAAGVNA